MKRKEMRKTSLQLTKTAYGIQSLVFTRSRRRPLEFKGLFARPPVILVALLMATAALRFFYDAAVDRHGILTIRANISTAGLMPTDAGMVRHNPAGLGHLSRGHNLRGSPEIGPYGMGLKGVINPLNGLDQLQGLLAKNGGYADKIAPSSSLVRGDMGWDVISGDEVRVHGLGLVRVVDGWVCRRSLLRAHLGSSGEHHGGRRLHRTSYALRGAYL